MYKVYNYSRCRNSLEILMRQDKAADLKTCVCDGREDYDCRGIHRNMHLLCFNKTEDEYALIIQEQYPNTITNEVGDVNSGESIYIRASYIILIALLILLKGKYLSYIIFIHLHIHTNIYINIYACTFNILNI